MSEEIPPLDPGTWNPSAECAACDHADIPQLYYRIKYVTAINSESDPENPDCVGEVNGYDLGSLPWNTSVERDYYEGAWHENVLSGPPDAVNEIVWPLQSSGGNAFNAQKTIIQLLYYGDGHSYVCPLKMVGIANDLFAVTKYVVFEYLTPTGNNDPTVLAPLSGGESISILVVDGYTTYLVGSFNKALVFMTGPQQSARRIKRGFSAYTQSGAVAKIYKKESYAGGDPGCGAGGLPVKDYSGSQEFSMNADGDDPTGKYNDSRSDDLIARRAASVPLNWRRVWKTFGVVVKKVTECTMTRKFQCGDELRTESLTMTLSGEYTTTAQQAQVDALVELQAAAEFPVTAYVDNQVDYKGEGVFVHPRRLVVARNEKTISEVVISLVKSQFKPGARAFGIYLTAGVEFNIPVKYQKWIRNLLTGELTGPTLVTSGVTCIVGPETGETDEDAGEYNGYRVNVQEPLVANFVADPGTEIIIGDFDTTVNPYFANKVRLMKTSDYSGG